MIKDTFEIEIGKRLQSTEAPVPAGSWKAIKMGIKTPPAAAPAQYPISGSVFVVGIFAATVMLVSLVVYSGNQPVHSRDSEIVKSAQPVADQIKSPVTVVQKTEYQSDMITTETIVENSFAPEENSVNEVIELVNTASSEPVSPRESIVGKPIDSNGVSEISAKKTELRKEKVLRENDKKELVPVSKAYNTLDISQPKAIIKADKLEGYAPLTVNFENIGEGEKFYWEFGYMAESDDDAPEVIFEEPGIYTVFLTVENLKGEIDEDFIEITVKEGSKFYVHDAFTPNGDGQNDTYKIEGALNIKDFYIIITDENGKPVFESKDINRAWEFDQSVYGNADTKFFVSYRAIGIDEKIYKEDRKPIHIFY